MIARTPAIQAPYRRVCYFSGRVQGVGFRYSVKNIALQFNVLGYVRNMPDGRVELVMEGDTNEMDHLVDAISSKMNSYIQKLDIDILPANGEFDHFYIRH